MKSLIKITVLAALLFCSSHAEAVELSKKIIGTWLYNSKEVPMNYQNAEVIFYEIDGKLQGKIKMEYGSIPIKKVITENDKITFEFILEYSTCTANLEYKGKELIGHVTMTEGPIALTLTKQPKQKVNE